MKRFVDIVNQLSVILIHILCTYKKTIFTLAKLFSCRINYFHLLHSPMEQLENKTWWTLEEHRSYFGLKNLLAARRWCHRRGVRIAHGMVNKNEIFNCLSGTANVPRSSLYKCITKNETQKQGDENGRNTTDIRNHQNREQGPQPDAGTKPALLYGRAAKRANGAGGVGGHHSGAGLQGAGRNHLVGAV